jgi:predicted TIM-barrel fold metal-dependent hydrolase
VCLSRLESSADRGWVCLGAVTGLLTFEQIGWDRLLFATDYPHWDFDDPRNALKVQLPEQRKRLLLHDNAVQLYGLSN